MTTERDGSTISDWSVIALEWPPALSDWSPPEVWGPPGSSATIVTHEVGVFQEGPFLEKRLAVLVKVDGPEPRVGTFLQYPVQRRKLHTIDELSSYLRALAAPQDLLWLREEVDQLFEGGEDERPWEKRWSADGGPELSTHSVSTALDLNQDFIELNKLEDGRFALSDGELRYLLRRAYQLGWEVREDQIPGEVARSKTIASSERRRQDALAWKAAFIAWLQGEADALNQGRRSPLTLEKLVDHALANWPRRGFGSQKVSPSRRTLEQAIRDGRKAGKFVHARARGGAETTSA